MSSRLKLAAAAVLAVGALGFAAVGPASAQGVVIHPNGGVAIHTGPTYHHPGPVYGHGPVYHRPMYRHVNRCHTTTSWVYRNHRREKVTRRVCN